MKEIELGLYRDSDGLFLAAKYRDKILLLEDFTLSVDDSYDLMIVMKYKSANNLAEIIEIHKEDYGSAPNFINIDGEFNKL